MGRAPEPAGFVGFRCTEIRGSKCPWSEFCGRVTRASPDEPSMARRGFLLPSVAAKRCRWQYKPRSNHGRFVRGVRVRLQTSPQGNLEPLILVQRNQPAPPRHNHRRFCHFPTGIHISYRKFRHFPTGIHIPITMQG